MNVNDYIVSGRVDIVPDRSAVIESRPPSASSHSELSLHSSLRQTHDEFVSYARTEASDYFNYGVVKWQSGMNKNLEMDIINFSEGKFRLFEPMTHPIQSGDQYEIWPGCDLRFVTCRVKYRNGVNFGGFPAIPGLDDVFNYPNAV